MKVNNLRSATDIERQAARDEVKRVLRQTNNVSETARILGVSRQTIHKWRNLMVAGKSLQLKERGRRRMLPPLTADQLIEIRIIILEQLPSEAGLPYLLWSNKAVRSLIQNKHNLSLPLEWVTQFLIDWNIISNKSAAEYWDTNILWSSKAFCWRNDPSIQEIIQEQNRQPYFMEVSKLSFSNTSKTHRISAVTKRGHLKFMFVNWDLEYCKEKGIVWKWMNSYRLDCICLFLRQLKKQIKKPLIVLYVEGNIRKHMGVVVYNFYRCRPSGTLLIRVSKNGQGVHRV